VRQLRTKNPFCSMKESCDALGGSFENTCHLMAHLGASLIFMVRGGISSLDSLILMRTTGCIVAFT
jgi:hypothetical protein